MMQNSKKICNLWAFWSVLQLINNRFKIRQKAFFCRILKRWFISWITGQNVQTLQIFAIFESFLWGNPKKEEIHKINKTKPSCSLWVKYKCWSTNTINKRLAWFPSIILPDKLYNKNDKALSTRTCHICSNVSKGLRKNARWDVSLNLSQDDWAL